MANALRNPENLFLTSTIDSLNQATYLALDHHLSTYHNEEISGSILSSVLLCFFTILFTVMEDDRINEHERPFYVTAYLTNFSQTIGAILCYTKSSQFTVHVTASKGIASALNDALLVFFTVQLLKCQVEFIAIFLVLVAFARMHNGTWLLWQTIELLRKQFVYFASTPLITVRLVIETANIYLEVFCPAITCIIHWVVQAYRLLEAIAPAIMMELDRRRDDFDKGDEEELDRARRRASRVARRRRRRRRAAERGP